MPARLGQGLCLALSLLALWSCASIADLPHDLQQSAQCIAASLSGTPGISNVGVTASKDAVAGDFAAVHYSFVDAMRRRHTVRFGVYKDMRLMGTGILFDAAEAVGAGSESYRGNPANQIEGKWGMQCGATGILITA
jgi:hypothetical protein